LCLVLGKPCGGNKIKESLALRKFLRKVFSKGALKSLLSEPTEKPIAKNYG